MDRGRVPGGLGIDVAGTHVHCVELAADGSVVRAEVVRADTIEAIVPWAKKVGVVAIDAPQAPSTKPHRGDTTLKPKFQAARCAEIALGRERGIWVSWVTPVSGFKPWMSTGLALYRALTGAAELLETYPQGIFRTLAGSTIDPKSTQKGLARRVELLRDAHVRDAGLAMWSHDGLDAAAAALVALQRAQERAESVTCGHDGSAIWLPARQYDQEGPAQ